MFETLALMDGGVVAGFMIMAVALYFTPGADMMFTLASGISGGPRAGAAAAAGISLGVLCHVVFAAAGLAVLLQSYPAAFDLIRYLGVAYLVYLAVQSWRAGSEFGDVRGRAGLFAAFRRGLLTNLLNPKVALFVLAFLPQFTDPAIGPVWHQILWLGLFLALGGMITDGAFGVFAGLMAARMRRFGGVMNKVASFVFGGIAAKLILD
ncbi:threonine transporter RhtB [Amylibacter marinus]|uniref:Threonine transporter RhtB n=2 Tax=Amylibacter marinus TaxID=1475483 RepID=A0ABQ5VWX0_9RHOB|nr:threonine transporter RhtB [Amylibacter marinus]